MKRLSILLLASVALMANAQNKIDFAGRQVLDRAREVGLDSDRNKHDGLLAPKTAGSDVTEQTYNVIVEFADRNFDYGDIAVEEISRCGNMAVVNATAGEIEQLAELADVVSVTLGFEKKSLMYKARPACKVDEVQNGEDGLGMKYSGKGIVTGLFDTGLDVNHINFIDADGNPRTRAVWAYSSGGKLTSYTTPEQVKAFTTENTGETHGTHVLGIMSGNYNGPAKYAILGGANGRSAQLVKQEDEGSAVPFYGIATGADLAVGCGTLSDGNIASGVQKIVEYAASQGQPCVVNLSLGGNIGPHDGTDALAKFLSQLGEEAIICVAAGNEGDERISITTSGKILKTFTQPTTASGSGIIDLWSSDGRPFTVRFFGYDKAKGQEVFSYTLSENLGGKTIRNSAMDGFSTAFSGSASLSSNISPSNNRYNVTASLNVTGRTTTILAGFVIEPLEGQTVDGFANNMEFCSESIPGFTSGSAKNSINNMACGENVIAVGSFTTAGSWAALAAGGDKATSYSYQVMPTVGAISGFSSYGKTFAGKQLPDICAPGQGIISSFSKYYVESAPASATQSWVVGEYASPKGLFSRKSPWGLTQGTSMACPFVAGVIALWLEADPTLTVDDVKAIIKETAVNDLFTTSDRARFGAGKLDALAGIKAVLGKSGISDVTADEQEAIVTAVSDKSYEVFVAGAKNLKAKLYNLSGLCVAEAASDDDTVVLSADTAAAGVYVLRVDSDRNSESRKIVIR